MPNPKDRYVNARNKNGQTVRVKESDAKKRGFTIIDAPPQKSAAQGQKPKQHSRPNNSSKGTSLSSVGRAMSADVRDMKQGKAPSRINLTKKEPSLLEKAGNFVSNVFSPVTSSVKKVIPKAKQEVERVKKKAEKKVQAEYNKLTPKQKKAYWDKEKQEGLDAIDNVALQIAETGSRFNAKTKDPFGIKSNRATGSDFRSGLDRGKNPYNFFGSANDNYGGTQEVKLTRGRTAVVHKDKKGRFYAAPPTEIDMLARDNADRQEATIRKYEDISGANGKEAANKAIDERLGELNKELESMWKEDSKVKDSTLAERWNAIRQGEAPDLSPAQMAVWNSPLGRTMDTRNPDKRNFITVDNIQHFSTIDDRYAAIAAEVSQLKGAKEHLAKGDRDKAYSKFKFGWQHAIPIFGQALAITDYLSDGGGTNFLINAGDKAANIDTWLPGAELRNAKTLLRTSRKLEKDPTGKSLSTQEKRLIESTSAANTVKSDPRYARSKSGEYGEMAGMSLPYLVDFAVGSRGVMAATRGTASSIGKASANWGVRQGVNKAGRYAMRVAGDFGQSVLMANTLQADDVALKFMNNMTGNAVMEFDKDGNKRYKFADKMGGWEAFWKAEASQTIENMSEMFGEYLPAIGRGLGVNRALSATGRGALKAVKGMKLDKAAHAIGLKSILNAYNSPRSQGIGKFLRNAGYHGIFGEITEEVVADFAHLIDGETQWKDIKDPEHWRDIVLGTTFSSMLLGSPNAISGTMAARQYYKADKMVRTNDARAESIIGAQAWSPLRAQFENTDNARIDMVFADIDNKQKSGELTKEQANAARKYGMALLNLRATNMVHTDNSKNMSRADIVSMNSFITGYNADDAQRRQAVLTHDELSLKAAVELGYVKDPRHDEDIWTAMTAEQKKAALDDAIARSQEVLENTVLPKYGATIEEQMEYAAQMKDVKARELMLDYLQSKTRVEGVVESVKDDIDEQADAVDAQVEKITNKESGKIQSVRLRTTGKMAYVVNGNVMVDDMSGDVDTDASSRLLTVRFADTGELALVDIYEVERADEAIDDVDAYKTQLKQQIRDKAITDTESALNGAINFTPGATISILGSSGVMQVTIDGEPYVTERGTRMVPVVVNGQKVAWNANDLQAMHEDYEKAATKAGEVPASDYDRGYGADEAGRKDIAIEASLGVPGSDEAWNGVVAQITATADYNVAQARERAKEQQHKQDGNYHYATLKEEDGDGNRKRVMIVDGHVEMLPDGSGVDASASDRSIVVLDPATGEKRVINPSSDLGISRIERVVSAEDMEAEMAASRNDEIRAGIDAATGRLRFDMGDSVPTSDGSEGTVVGFMDAEHDEMIVRKADGSMESVRLSDLQEASDAAALEDYRRRHGISGEDGGGVRNVSEAVGEGLSSSEVVPATFADLRKVGTMVVREDADGNLQAGEVAAVPFGGQVEIVWDDGRFGESVEYTEEELAQIGVRTMEAQADYERAVAKQQAQQAQQPQPAEAPAQPTEQPTAEPMPVREDGEEDWQATTPERAHSYIFNEAGLSRSEGNEFIAAQTKAAQKALVKAKSAQMPRVGTSIKKYNEAKAKRQEKIDEAQRALDYWKQVRNIQNDIQRVENERRAAEDAVRHDEAVAKAQAEYEARKQAEAERKAVGNENPMPAITEKWNNATKVDGHRDEIMLPDGTALKGHYVLHESGASSPSHNPETWQKTDGFPMDANDNSVNDRDYERDRDAQEHTQSIARQYDQRALQSVPVVSNDGVVLSGNGRTMAGELAARDNTDGAYVNYLKEYASKFGFTPEQVEAMQHPRVSFVPDEAMPYTAETFAKFNQQEMKSQSKTEQAVKLGKTVNDDSFKGIVRTINGYDTLGDFYNDADASLGAVYDLHNAGVIPQAQLAEMVDGVRGQEKLSAVGREFLENMLIGKAFEGDPEVVRMLTEEPAMRQTVITALGEIVDNIALGGDWSLQGELADAVKLCFDARQGGAKYGEIVSTYARQGVLFADPDELQTVADFNNATMLMLADVLNDKRVTLLKTTLQLYNNNARQSASGQTDLFAGGIQSREDILRDVITFINENYGKRKEIEAARAEAVERRKAESVQQDGTPPAVSTDGEATAEPSAEPAPVEAEPVEATAPVEAEPNAVQAALAAAEQETNTEPTEAQKEAGNYKKGHVKIDGYDVTIENPKGSVRRGTDASGKQWEQEMQNTYGYIRGTEGVDGDHIDVFFSEDPSQGDVFVVDQVNKDGSFDEHKVMYGFPDIESARKAYLSNYKDGWQGLGAITPVSKKEFKKWIDSSHRKTKPFAEYSSVKPLGDTQLGEQPNKPTVKAGEDYVSAAERIAKEHEVKRMTAHFPMETAEEAAAFDRRVAEMDDAELLAYMQEDGKGDVNKAHHPSVYDEYDYRHSDEQLQSYDDTLVRLNESGTTLEQAEEMLANIQKGASRLATDERAMLLGQEEALQEYIAGLEKIFYDRQGNPVDADGNLILEEISSVYDLKGDDFANPSRNVQLPKIPDAVDKAICANGKAVIIKKNIFEKNKANHPELKPSQSKGILHATLYNPFIVGQAQPKSRPNYWVAVESKDGESVTVIEVNNNNKDNIEVVGWHKLDKKGLEKLRKQAEREDGQLLILTSGKEAAAALSTLPPDVSVGKVTDLFGNEQGSGKKSSSDGKLEKEGERDVAMVSQQTEENSKYPLPKLTEQEQERMSELVSESRSRRLSREERDELRILERKERILLNGTGFDKDFGLKPVREISSVEDIDANISKIVNGLKQHEGDGSFNSFEGFAYHGAYKENAGHQVQGYLNALSGVIPDDLGRVWLDNHGLKTEEDLRAYGESLYDNAKALAEALSNEEAVQDAQPRYSMEGERGGKIDDVGEVLAGARKDMRRKIAESLANVTEAALIEKPFGKVYKKPDLKKAVESGALREKDAIFYEALFSMINQQKPKVTQSEMRSKRYIPDYKTKAERWASSTYKAIETLRQFMEADEAHRDELIDAAMKDRYPNREKELAEIEQRKRWNPDREDHKYEWGEMTTPNPLWVTHEVMKRLGYSVGDKLDVPYGVVTANTSGTGYSIENLKGESASVFGRGMTLDEAIDRIVYLAKLKRGDADVSHPTQLFAFPATKSEMGESGRFRVMWGRDFKTRDFDSKEDADAFAQTKNGAYVSPIMETKRRFGYKVRFIHPLTGEKMFVDDAEFDTEEEAQAYFDGNFEKLNEATNAKLQAEREKKGEKKTLTADDVVHVTMVPSGKRGWTHAVVIDKKYANNDGQVRIIKESFASRKDAKAFADSVKDDVLKTVLKHKEEAKKIVYFDTGENSRIGEDYRNDKDVDAEDFMNTFGFRGVQFGNWTNQADRQMAVNQAYDAFMDMAKLIGVSPKAMSLNGELGIAFGARGVGGFAAHYERGEVVINLTKKNGAGSLAHEWWHALDNYFARRAGSAGDMVTDNRRIEMRDALRKAFNDMLDMIKGSEYVQRSVSKGEYWGRTREVTARLLAEWVDRELKKRGELNTFLSRGAVVERGQQANYATYSALEVLAGREPMPFEDYKETSESLKGIPYPSAKEVEQFGESLRHIFDTLEEKVDEETGNVMLYEPTATYETRDGGKVVCRSLFDEMGLGDDAEVAMVSQQTEQDSDASSAFAPSDIRLRKLKKGETCHVERVYEETKQFDFTGKEKVESAEDVAYIFRQLENAAVENSFLVLVKDGRPTVIHLGVGSYVNVMAPYEQALVAYTELKPNQVYFVHNHPSGTLKASRQDQELLNRIKRAFGEDVVQQGIIIDTTSGNYGEFESIETAYETYSVEEEMPKSQGNDVPIKVYQFSRQVFAPDWDPESAFKIVSSQSVAEFVSSHRLGEHKKMSFLVVNNSGNVVANVFLPWTKLSDIKRSKDAGDLLAGYVHQCGGVRGVLYGNYDYEADDRPVLAAVGGRMRKLNAPLMDALHVEHSAYGSGWAGVGEPGAGYGADYEIHSIKTANGKFNKFLGDYMKGNLQRSDVLRMPNNGNLSLYLPNSKDILLKQSVINKAHKKHNISLESLFDLPEKLHHPILVFKSSREDVDGVVVLIDAKDNDGNNVTVAIDLNGNFNEVAVNDITSMYGKDSYTGYAAWSKNILTGDEEKLKAWIASLPENDKRGVSKSTLSALEERLHEVLSDGAKVRNNSETQAGNGENFAEDSARYRFREDEAGDIHGENFKNWFGDWENDAENASKMVDENGEPKVFYHNTPNVFSVFDASRNGTHNDAGWLGDGFYFYGVEGEGNSYGENQMAVYLNIRNPYYATSEEMERLAEANSREESIAFRERLEAEGYDGIYYNGDLREEAVAFYPNQIKSATENVGTYDAGNDDVRYRKSDELNTEYGGVSIEEKRRAVEQMGEKLHTNINIIEDVNEITHPNAEIEANRRRAKGWYDQLTRQVYIVLPNNRDIDDAKVTVAHEVIAHKGLRELIGEERYNEFLDKTYSHLRDDLKKGVDAAAGRAFIDDTTKNGKRAKSYEEHRRTAVDELFGRLAEKPFEEFSDGERTLWQQIKATVRRLLDKFLGSLKLPKWFELGDNELRYILWRSKERMERGKEDPIDLARDIVKREELRLSNEVRYYLSDADLLFRNSSLDDDVRRSYDKKVRSFRKRLKEAWIDYLQSVDLLQEEISKFIGRPLKSSENAYQRLVMKSSRDKREQEDARRTLLAPIRRAVGSVRKGKMFRPIELAADENSAWSFGEERKMNMGDVETYLALVHGLERNAYMAREYAIAEHNKGLLDDQIDPDYEPTDAEIAAQRRDYSGMTGTFFAQDDDAGLPDIDIDVLESMARDYISAFENAVNDQNAIDALWGAVKAATDYTIDKSVESGLYSAERGEQVKAMFEHYVPLRGFGAETQEDISEYIDNDGRGSLNPAIKKMRGRKSKPDSIFGTIGSMVDTSIISGNKNAAKQALLNLAVAYMQERMSKGYTDNTGAALVVSEQWYEDDGNGNAIPVYPPSLDGLSPKEQAAALDAFEAEMQEKRQNGNAFTRSSAPSYLRFEKKLHEDQHAIHVKRGGREYVIWVCGEPRASQAVNGLLNVDAETGSLGGAVRVIQDVNRYLARTQTSLSPEFMLRNLMRDAQTAAMQGLARYGAEYASRVAVHVAANLTMSPKRGATNNIWTLYRKYEKGEISETKGNTIERYFCEFLKMGGETGYSQLWSVAEYRKYIENGKGLLNDILSPIEFLNQGVENAVRFAAFTASREQGRDAQQSAWDAKEMSINFNRKGSGKMGNAVARSLYCYVNPALQSAYQMYVNTKEHPIKMTAIAGSMILAGFLMATFGSMLCGAIGGDDDYEDYYNALSSFKRRNFLNIPIGNGEFFSLSLPQENQVFYGIGHVIGEQLNGRLRYEDAAGAYFSQIERALPLDYTTGSGVNSEEWEKGLALTFAPSATRPIVENMVDMDFQGRPISRSTPYNKELPEWQKANKNTPEWLVSGSRWLNNFGGGRDSRKGAWLTDINPSKVEHAFVGYTGGIGTFVNKCAKSIAWILGDVTKADDRNIPMRSAVITSANADYAKNQARQTVLSYYEKRYEEYNSAVKADQKLVASGKLTATRQAENIQEFIDEGTIAIAEVMRQKVKKGGHKRGIQRKTYIDELRKEAYALDNAGDHEAAAEAWKTWREETDALLNDLEKVDKVH